MVAGVRPLWLVTAGAACAGMLAISVPASRAAPGGVTHEPPPATFASVASAAAAATITLRTVRAGPLPEIPSGDEEDEPCEEGDGSCEQREDFRKFLARFIAAMRRRTLASGVIVHDGGLAITSARAVLGVGDFEVVLGDGTTVDAMVVGLDRRTDVAILKLATGSRIYPWLPLGDSDAVRPGDWVIAVGAPHGLAGSVTAGVVTATPAQSGTSPAAAFLQTDAVLDHGTPGGPVVNLAGEVVGIASALVVDGVSHATPSRVVRHIVLELLEHGRVIRPWLGVSTQTLSEDVARALGAQPGAGVLVTDVAPGGPAGRAGLEPGDVVLEIDAIEVDSRAQLERAVNHLAIGRTTRVKLWRDGRDRTLRVKVGEQPDEWALPPAQARARSLTGLEVRPITAEMGVVVTWAEPGSPADAAGIERGDVLRAIDRRRIRTVGDFEAAARRLRPGAPVLVHVQRGEISLYVTLRSEAPGGNPPGATPGTN